MDDFFKGILMNEEIEDSRIFWEPLSSSNYALPIVSLKAYDLVSRNVLRRLSHPLVPNALPKTQYSYCLATDTYKHKTANLARGCTLKNYSIVGKNTSIGKGTVITDSVIGDNCKIGENVHIEHSYIMSNLTIENNVTIRQSIVLDNSHLYKNVEIDGCIVSRGTKVKADRTYTDFVIKDNSCVPINGDEVNERILFFKKTSNEIVDTSCIFDETDSSEDNESVLNFADDDDTDVFLNEVSESLLRGFQCKVHCDNLILEINSSRYANNVSMNEVAFTVIKALLTLPVHYLTKVKNEPVSTKSYQSTLQDMNCYFLQIIAHYIKTNIAQGDCLRAVDDVAMERSEFVGFLLYFIQDLYNKNVLTEDNIMLWYESFEHDDDEERKVVKEKIYPFIEWLRVASEESSEDD